MNETINQDQAPQTRWRERIKSLNDIPPLFAMVWKSAPRVVIANLFLRLTVALIPLAMLAVTRVIIDSIYGFTSHQRALPSIFWWLVVLEFALGGLAAILARCINFCDVILADRYTHYVSVRIMKHAGTLDLTTFENPHFQDMLERARVQGTDRVAMIQSAGLLVQQFVTTASLAASIYLVSPWILVALLACLIPSFLGETHFAFLGYSLSFRQTPARREMEYLRLVGGSKESAKELRLFGLGSFLVERFSALSTEIRRQNFGLARRKLIMGSLLTVLGTLGYYGAYTFAIYQTVAGRLTLGTLTFLAGAIAGASTNIQLFFTTFSIIADQSLFLSDLLKFFSIRPTVVSKPGALLVPRPVRGGFEFKNVSFSYPGHSKFILKDASFCIEPSQRVALVGENGEGKTTIVKLLTRMYDPTTGQILLDGVDLREYALDDLWKEIGVIFQDFMRYEMTASNNIAVGQIEARNNAFRIRSAAIKSLADGLIRKLPRHYEQVLGCRFEGGVDISGGEWQKIALARAYLRDAQLLILDEPTASLDARSEREVFQRFAHLTEDKMALLISHRFSTVRMADRILVLEKGQIAEDGTHDGLIKSGGRYAEMFELQASNYR